MHPVMTCGCTAIISKDDPRAELWQYVLGCLEVPLKHPVPEKTNFGLCYAADPTKLTPEQRERLIEKMAEKFHLQRSEVVEDLEKGFLPIKAENVTLNICPDHFRAIALSDDYMDDPDDFDQDPWEDEDDFDDEE